MPSDEYAAVGGGALKLKGAKVGKKKKRKDKGDLSKNLSTGDDVAEKRRRSPMKDDPDAEEKDRRKEEDEDDDRPVQKTDSERQFEELKKKRLLQMAGSRPELLKTHKERVEGLNSYLSKLSEHHDMPKIGPG